MTLTRLVLWRHGETDYNATGRLQGHFDSHLTDVGRAQARRAVPVLVGFAPSIVVSSDLARAADTAGVYAEEARVRVRLDKRLRETHLGEWQGLTQAQVEARWPGALRTWRTDPRWAPPGGEARVEVAARGAEVVAELDAEVDGTALLCAHGGLISAVTGRLLGLPLETWPLLGGITNCHWTVLTRRSDGDGQWRLTAYNAGLGG
ncbi:putative phosphoglycerate mutase [Streptoalloteichus tenebrarius]|uniref:Phosphoglycerate mutase n=1 Tax=Streptoalloteichus tenebrarius (strain ATCC 17920 / DSM 40477 / JCM 4838 / CBS 697.72 / NBRC 16177 / NCIMB 11028 / NRRL B-12390 / A12253. 1 / ISP 5477) TaxID=1933 RepID=A0ABT1HXB3_STRSD|nr:histidine phosphatase family protein [Streptoalloteichus tenebrarius]MCP2260149.1 putative phosphoglycerate mutase [Streptoalloteichus tenebrarius]BFF00527.1 histidine phosphatase family protein [Streptoalloteichus tenebrarius]